MAKSALSKALDKRKKKSAKKGTKQVAPQSEHYSSKRDKKEKAKPAGYRFKGLDNFKTPTKKEIAADTGKPKKKRKTYFENRKDKSDKAPSQKLAKGGIVKDIPFETSNLYLLGKGHDVNGNFIVKVGFPNDRGFSIQTSGQLPNTNRIMHGIKKLSDITSDDMVLIESEVNNYVKEHGSDKQKKKLKLSNKFESGGPINISAHSGDNATTVQDSMVLEQGGPILPEDATQADVMANGGQVDSSKWISKTPRFRFENLTKDISKEKLDALLATIRTVPENYYLASISKVDAASYDDYKEFGTLMAAAPQLAWYLKGILRSAIYWTTKSGDPGFKDSELAKGAIAILESIGVKEEYEEGGELSVASDNQNNQPAIEIEPEIKVEPEVEITVETPQRTTIPNVEAAAYAENMIEFMGTNLEGKLLPNGDYVVLSFLFYPIWFYCAANKSWYGNTDKYNSVTAMHISQSRPTPNAEMLSIMQLLDKMNQGIQTYDLGGVLVRQLYPMTVDNTTVAHQ